LEQSPTIALRQSAKTIIQQQHHISSDDIIILFNGTLDYQPNLKALQVILSNINPGLLQHKDFNYKIIICGKNLPDHYHQLQAYQSANIIYAGFVNDINEYYLAADIFINPVIDGGGIKTKIVEALGYNVSLITTQSGAIGISKQITGNKMMVVADNDWADFIHSILKTDIIENIPDSYFQYFSWDKIARKAAKAIQKI
jgi:glycosyltransferase involved in cell wall biosynthesis